MPSQRPVQAKPMSRRLYGIFALWPSKHDVTKRAQRTEVSRRSRLLRQSKPLKNVVICFETSTLASKFRKFLTYKRRDSAPLFGINYRVSSNRSHNHFGANRCLLKVEALSPSLPPPLLHCYGLNMRLSILA